MNNEAAEAAAAEPAAAVANPSTDEVLASILAKAMRAAEHTGDFVITQAPDIVRQLIMYNTIATAFWLCFFIAMLITGLLAIRWGHKVANHSLIQDATLQARYAKIARDQNHFVAYVMGAVFSAIGALATVKHTLILIKLLVAPKVWLIEYAAELVK